MKISGSDQNVLCNEKNVAIRERSEPRTGKFGKTLSVQRNERQIISRVRELVCEVPIIIHESFR